MFAIHWDKVKPIYLSANEFKSLALTLDKSKLKKLDFFINQRLGRLTESYSTYGDNNGRCELRVYKHSPKRYVYLASKAVFDSVENESTGHEAYMIVNKLFEKLHKISIYSAFSGREYKNEYKAIKGCVPIQISYLNQRYAKKVISNVYKADVSSAFPSQIVHKSLPTLHGCKHVEGRVEPSEEYPFAFYVNSHHIAIYKELDTRTFKNEYYIRYYKQIYNDSALKEETILCKASKEDLDSPFQYLYDNRKGNQENKFYMNACIGYFHKNSNPLLSPIAAVVIARCNNDMIKKCAKITKDHNNTVLFIATDSIAWTGISSDVAIDDKYLGSFTYECKKGQFYGVGPKAYQILADGVVTTKYSGMKKDKQVNLKFGMLPDDDEYSEYSIHCLAQTKNGVYYPEKLM